MKLPEKFTINKPMTVRTGDEPTPDFKTSRARCNKVIEQVKEVVLERGVELDALLLCFITRQHMMLEGPHGVAKSMLAEEVFNRIKNATVYEKVMMRGTQPEEIFGPMNARLYREEGVWQHTTVGFLPNAHFGYVDEVYRGSDSLLGSLLSIMNERKFVNGSKVQRCPLITLIGTTNFTTESSELDAFHDRWIVRTKLKSLGASNLRVQMIKNYHERLLSPVDVNDSDLYATFSLRDLETIQDHLSEVEVPDYMYALYEELMRAYAKNVGRLVSISDRRLNLGFRLALAAALLDPDNKNMELLPQHFLQSQYAVCVLHDDAQTQPFDTANQTVIGTHLRNKVEVDEMRQTKKLVDRLVGLFEPDLNVPDCTKLYRKAEEVRSGIVAILQSGAKAPKLPTTVSSYQTMERELQGVILAIKEMPEMEKPIAALSPTPQGKVAAAQQAAGEKPNSNEVTPDQADGIERKNPGKGKPF